MRTSCQSSTKNSIFKVQSKIDPARQRHSRVHLTLMSFIRLYEEIFESILRLVFQNRLTIRNLPKMVSSNWFFDTERNFPNSPWIISRGCAICCYGYLRLQPRLLLLFEIRTLSEIKNHSSSMAFRDHFHLCLFDFSTYTKTCLFHESYPCGFIFLWWWEEICTMAFMLQGLYGWRHGFCCDYHCWYQVVLILDWFLWMGDVLYAAPTLGFTIENRIPAEYFTSVKIYSPVREHYFSLLLNILFLKITDAVTLKS